MRSLDTIGDNNKANYIAKMLGYSNAEKLKEDFVGKSEGRHYNIKYDKLTKELVLVRISDNFEINTDLYLPVTSW